jgi:hypothetical protein
MLSDIFWLQFGRSLVVCRVVLLLLLLFSQELVRKGHWALLIRYLRAPVKIIYATLMIS